MKRLLVCVLLCLALCAACPGARADSWGNTAYATTPTEGASRNKLSNIALAAYQIDGIRLEYGERFSFNEIVGERSKENGYKIALNGRGVKVWGGGVAQLATTIHLAVTEFGWCDVEPFLVYGDSFADTYVDDPSLAIVTDYANERDYAFTSYYPGTIEISCWVYDTFVECSIRALDGEGENLYTGRTSLSKNSAQRNNIFLACEIIWRDNELTCGETFSFNEVVGPRTAEYGFVYATNGRGVKTMGGGVAQVASAILLAARQCPDIEIDSYMTYGDNFTGTYVDDAADAVVTDYGAGRDFSFTYWGDGTLYIELTEENGYLVCELLEVLD